MRHQPSAFEEIQPYALMCVLAEPHLNVVRISENSLEMIGWEPADIIGRPFSLCLESSQMDSLLHHLRKNSLNTLQSISSTSPSMVLRTIPNQKKALRSSSPREMSPSNVASAPGPRSWYAFVQPISKHGFVLELEPVETDASNFGLYYAAPVYAIADEFTSAGEDDNQLCAVAARGISAITGYDRILVYRFEEDAHGVVLAEHFGSKEAQANMDSYLGLHFPASDIPWSSRRMFIKIRSRIIVDASAKSARILPGRPPWLPFHRRDSFDTDTESGSSSSAGSVIVPSTPSGPNDPASQFPHLKLQPPMSVPLADMDPGDTPDFFPPLASPASCDYPLRDRPGDPTDQPTLTVQTAPHPTGPQPIGSPVRFNLVPPTARRRHPTDLFLDAHGHGSSPSPSSSTASPPPHAEAAPVSLGQSGADSAMAMAALAEFFASLSVEDAKQLWRPRHVVPHFRAVAPCHASYMTNMKTSASMTVVIIEDNRTWGLIVGHHRTAKAIGPGIRAACMLVAQSLASALTYARARQERAGEWRVQQLQARLIKHAVEQNFLQALKEQDSNLCTLVDCGGAAIVAGNKTVLMGLTPTTEQVLELCAALRKVATEDLWHTESLKRHYERAAEIKDVASGVLMATISRTEDRYILWFRQERIQTVVWAGAKGQEAPSPLNSESSNLSDGEDPFALDDAEAEAELNTHRDEEQPELGPRASFESWKESVVMKSRPFGPADLGAAKAFLATVMALDERICAEERTKKSIQDQLNTRDHLLQQLLPTSIAHEILHYDRVKAKYHPMVSVLFADIVGFTRLSAVLPPTELVDRLNNIFSEFDRLAEKHNLEKIKTIGDAYMVAGGLPETGGNSEEAAASVARFAMDMLDVIEALPLKNGTKLTMRIGFHCGPCVAGVIGTKKFVYDIWGDTVNVASRMESHGVPGTVHVSQPVFRQLRGKFIFQRRGVINVKGKGNMCTYFLLGEMQASTSPKLTPCPSVHHPLVAAKHRSISLSHIDALIDTSADHDSETEVIADDQGSQCGDQALPSGTERSSSCKGLTTPRSGSTVGPTKKGKGAGPSPLPSSKSDKGKGLLGSANLKDGPGKDRDARPQRPSAGSASTSEPLGVTHAAQPSSLKLLQGATADLRRLSVDSRCSEVSNASLRSIGSHSGQGASLPKKGGAGGSQPASPSTPTRVPGSKAQPSVGHGAGHAAGAPTPTPTSNPGGGGAHRPTPTPTPTSNPGGRRSSMLARRSTLVSMETDHVRSLVRTMPRISKTPSGNSTDPGPLLDKERPPKDKEGPGQDGVRRNSKDKGKGIKVNVGPFHGEGAEGPSLERSGEDAGDSRSCPPIHGARELPNAQVNTHATTDQLLPSLRSGSRDFSEAPHVSFLPSVNAPTPDQSEAFALDSPRHKGGAPAGQSGAGLHPTQYTRPPSSPKGPGGPGTLAPNLSARKLLLSPKTTSTPPKPDLNRKAEPTSTKASSSPSGLNRRDSKTPL